MTKNPIINAILALGYICLVALVMFVGMQHTRVNDTILIPITMISLFTFSAATMGYIFLSNPIQLYLDGQKKAAVDLFLKTLASFGVITLILLIALFSGVLGG